MDERRGERTDADLVTQVVAGDERALAELYDRHADAVFRLCFRLLGDRHVAEEVMQETYLALWNRAELFDRTIGSLPAWLLAIARNRSVDRLRAQGRRPPALPISAVGGGDGDTADLERTAASGTLLGTGPGAPEPEAVIDATWLRETVRGALAEMPDVERRAVELAYYEELTQTEIAARLGWPLGTVKTRTRRALGRLRGLLADRLGPEFGRRVRAVPVTDATQPPVATAADRGRSGDGSR